MKVLILAYDFPPLISIGGQRPYSWFKYLPLLNIQVTVITRQWKAETSLPADYVQEISGPVVVENNGIHAKVIRVPFTPNIRDRLLLRFGIQKFALLRKILSFVYAFLEHIFFPFDSKSSIYYQAEKEIQQNQPDIIIATGEPFILFKYASALSKQYNIPWVADYRDTWTSNQGNYAQGPLQNLLSTFYRSREKIYISNAFFITTASPTYSESLKSIHPDKDIEVVYNGYDDSSFTGLGTITPPTNKFVITYGGTIYPHQNLEMFLDGLTDFIKQNNISETEMEVNFYGIDLQAEAKMRVLNYKKELDGYITAIGRIPYNELIKKLGESHLLLLLSRKNADWLNAKIFDYLAVKRTIFLVENDHGILASILKQTNGGVSLDSKEEVAAFLQNQYQQFKKGTLQNAAVNEQALKYSRKNQAQVLSNLLNTRLAAR